MNAFENKKKIKILNTPFPRWREGRKCRGGFECKRAKDRVGQKNERRTGGDTIYYKDATESGINVRREDFRNVSVYRPTREFRSTKLPPYPRRQTQFGRCKPSKMEENVSSEPTVLTYSTPALKIRSNTRDESDIPEEEGCNDEDMRTDRISKNSSTADELAGYELVYDRDEDLFEDESFDRIYTGRSPMIGVSTSRAEFVSKSRSPHSRNILSADESTISVPSIQRIPE